MLYYLNQNTKTLHIGGYCRHTNTIPKDYLSFSTEDAAISYGGLTIKRCMLCQREKEKRLTLSEYK